MICYKTSIIGRRESNEDGHNSIRNLSNKNTKINDINLSQNEKNTILAKTYAYIYFVSKCPLSVFLSKYNFYNVVESGNIFTKISNIFCLGCLAIVAF